MSGETGPTFARRLLLGMLAVGSSLLATTLIGEGIVRIASPAFAIVAPAIREPDPARGYRLIPGVSSRATYGREYDVTYRINALGLRDRDYETAAGGRHVLVLGDSFTFGTGVELEQTFAKRLEEGLARRGAGPAPAVVNMGVYGYSSEQSLKLLEDVGSRFRPDLVIYVLVAAYDFPRNTDGIQPMPLGSLPGWLRNGVSHSHLAQFAFKTMALLGSRKAWEAPAVLSAEAPEMFGAGVLRAGHALGRMSAWARDRGAGFVVAYLPVCYELNRQEWEVRGVGAYFDETLIPEGAPTMPLALASGIVRDGGHRFVDLLGALRESKATGLYYLKDRHLTPEGHEVVAGALEEALAPDLEPTRSAGRPAEPAPSQQVDVNVEH